MVIMVVRLQVGGIDRGAVQRGCSSEPPFFDRYPRPVTVLGLQAHFVHCLGVCFRKSHDTGGG